MTNIDDVNFDNVLEQEIGLAMSELEKSVADNKMLDVQNMPRMYEDIYDAQYKQCVEHGGKTNLQNIMSSWAAYTNNTACLITSRRGEIIKVIPPMIDGSRLNRDALAKLDFTQLFSNVDGAYNSYPGAGDRKLNDVLGTISAAALEGINDEVEEVVVTKKSTGSNSIDSDYEYVY